MTRTKKLVPFDIATAIEKGNVKLADGRRVTIITYNNHVSAMILGHYAEPSGIIKIGEWHEDGTVADAVGSDTPELRLEVDDIDFFPRPWDKVVEGGADPDAIQTIRRERDELLLEREALKAKLENTLSERDQLVVRIGGLSAFARKITGEKK